MNLTKTLILLAIIISALLMIQGCEDMLNEPIQSQLASENLLNNKRGIETVLADGYSQGNHSVRIRNSIKREEMTADILWQTGGGENGTAIILLNFVWDPASDYEAFDWGNYWRVIRDANIVLENVDRIESPEDEKQQLKAEARFIRIWAYYQLWNQYGPMPIRKSTEDPLELPRASEQDFHQFMESELLAAIPILPAPGSEPNYGRAHSGGARALLCKWYLNTHQWQKCVDMAQEIINSGHFKLYDSYHDLFALENERNSEFILVKTGLANQPNSISMLATSFPWGFYKALDGGIAGVINDKWANFASQYRLYDEFYNSFEPGDERKNRILTLYIDTQGDTVDLLRDYDDATRGIKYPPDPNTQGVPHGNDFPFIRYADILLSKAEALNELNGPNQESIDLINQIRHRAGLGDVFLTDFASKEVLRDHLLKERRWEFWYEAKRRRDLIRTGKYIEFAKQRGIIQADEHHLWFPIPQSALDANPKLTQNPGY